jgi:hypothetical protein
MDLRRRVAALEAALAARDEPFADPAYAVALEREILGRRLIPLPPLDGVDLDATAVLWARGGDRCGFVMDDGSVRMAPAAAAGAAVSGGHGRPSA